VHSRSVARDPPAVLDRAAGPGEGHRHSRAADRSGHASTNIRELAPPAAQPASVDAIVDGSEPDGAADRGRRIRAE
jgi:hypothetical protein